ILGVILWKENILDIFKPYPYALTRVDNFPAVVETANKVTDKKRIVISTQEEFDKVLNELLSDKTKVKIPTIDFDKNRVIIAASETNETTGYSVKISSVIKDDQNKKLNTIVTFTKPGETCINEEKTNVAIDMVTVEKNDFEVEFDRETRTKECAAK
ncbi:MAG: hypothetical protein EBV07_00250, partial [Proteobacteria bacterium]|nr:hypothetical protein [Pseudomonadota bacterium]